MVHLSEAPPHVSRLQLAVQERTPIWMARTFATLVGQFYDRAAFDTLARDVSELYAIENPDAGCTFRAHLDRRLYDRYHAPVVWDTVPQGDDAA